VEVEGYFILRSSALIVGKLKSQKLPRLTSRPGKWSTRSRIGRLGSPLLPFLRRTVQFLKGTSPSLRGNLSIPEGGTQPLGARTLTRREGMVGDIGLEPTTSSMSTRRSTN
jgi:hypothetical protein